MTNLEKKKVAALILVVCLSITLAYALLKQTTIISNVGVVKTFNVTIWQDVDRTIELTSIEWGMLWPGEEKTVEGYLWSDGNTNTILSMTTSNWNPNNASLYLVLTWDRENYILQPKTMCLTTLTLTVASVVVGVESFSFDILITATES